MAMAPYDESSKGLCPIKKQSKEKKPVTKKTWRGRLLPTDEKPWRKQKFIDKWVDDEKFKGWLSRHPEDPTLARCISCNQELVAGKSELIKHSQTRKHIKSLQNFDGSTTESESSLKSNNTPMFVWVLNDQEGTSPTAAEAKVIDASLLCSFFFEKKSVVAKVGQTMNMICKIVIFRIQIYIYLVYMPEIKL